MESIMGTITEIHRAAFDDGPGVRTVVFVKGCPLTCLWCHNPETQNSEPEHMTRGGKKELIGRKITPEEVMQIVRQDIGHYKATGGGLTISGGEPLAQREFCRMLLKLAKSEGIHTCIETCGAGNVQSLMPYTDLWLFDIKGLPGEYEKLTGGSFAPIEESLHTLLAGKASVILRCPIVPGFHDNSEYSSFLYSLTEKYPGVTGVEKLPFHNFGMYKYEALGRISPMDNI